MDFLEKQVVDFFKQNGIEFSSNNISTCHTLGKPRDGIKRMILVKFTNRKIKEHILKNKKKLKGTGVFVNEHKYKHKYPQKMLTFPYSREHCEGRIKYRTHGQGIARFT